MSADNPRFRIPLAFAKGVEPGKPKYVETVIASHTVELNDGVFEDISAKMTASASPIDGSFTALTIAGTPACETVLEIYVGCMGLLRDDLIARTQVNWLVADGIIFSSQKRALFWGGLRSTF